jgi:alkylation response protein AidB-like acyl-CoA dehydrogenase
VNHDFYEAEHEDFRRSVRTFLDREVVPHHQQWERDGQVSREVWPEFGHLGGCGRVGGLWPAVMGARTVDLGH